MEICFDPNVEAIQVYRVLAAAHYQQVINVRAATANFPELTEENLGTAIELRALQIQSNRDTLAFVRAAISCAKITKDKLEA